MRRRPRGRTISARPERGRGRPGRSPRVGDARDGGGIAGRLHGGAARGGRPGRALGGRRRRRAAARGKRLRAPRTPRAARDRNPCRSLPEHRPRRGRGVRRRCRRQCMPAARGRGRVRRIPAARGRHKGRKAPAPHRRRGIAWAGGRRLAPAEAGPATGVSAGTLKPPPRMCGAHGASPASPAGAGGRRAVRGRRGLEFGRRLCSVCRRRRVRPAAGPPCRGARGPCRRPQARARARGAIAGRPPRPLRHSACRPPPRFASRIASRNPSAIDFAPAPYALARAAAL